MSSKRALRRASCGCKQRHADATAAHAHAASLRRLSHAKGDTRGAIDPYPCRFCGGWHVGHRPGSGAINKRGAAR